MNVHTAFSRHKTTRPPPFYGIAAWVLPFHTAFSLLPPAQSCVSYRKTANRDMNACLILHLVKPALIHARWRLARRQHRGRRRRRRWLVGRDAAAALRRPLPRRRAPLPRPRVGADRQGGPKVELQQQASQHADDAAGGGGRGGLGVGGCVGTGQAEGGHRTWASRVR